MSPISTNDWAWWQAPVTPTTWRSTNRRIMGQAVLGIKQDPLSKVTNNKGLVKWLKW
jgi:hypothetical protein